MSTHFDFNIIFYCLQTNFKTKEYCKIHLSFISWLATIKSVSTREFTNFVIVVTYCLSWTGDLLWQLKLRILFSAVSFISLDLCIFCHYFQREQRARATAAVLFQNCNRFCFCYILWWGARQSNKLNEIDDNKGGSVLLLLCSKFTWSAKLQVRNTIVKCL